LRTQAFKDYILSRASKRGNPYNFSSIEDYSLELTYLMAPINSSSWTYEDILEDKYVDFIVPQEVVDSKLVKAIFTSYKQTQV
jgi:hypothetical protein